MKLAFSLQPTDEGLLRFYTDDVKPETYGEIERKRGFPDMTMTLSLREGSPDAELKRVGFSPCLITGHIEILP